MRSRRGRALARGRWIAILLFTAPSLLASGAGRDFSAIDAAVTGMPAARSIDDVVRFIAGAAHDDWEKARGAYVWVTRNIAYDADAFFTGRETATDAQGVFASRKSVCQGYSSIFASIAQGLGLEAQTISGWAKGYGYSPGQHFADTNHAWNAVKLDGAWHLMDTTWGSGYVTTRGFVPSYTTAWFDMDPRLFALHHLPEDPSWLLTARPTTLAEYEKATYVELWDVVYLLDDGFTADEVVGFLPCAPFPEYFGSYARAFHAMGGTAVDIAGYLAEGAFPAAHSYAKLAPMLLEFPRTTRVKPGATYRFSVRLPGCAEAAVITGGQFFDLDKQDDVFTGEATAASGPMKLSVHITYNGVDAYWPIMEWYAK